MKFRQALFWDTNPKKIDVKKHARYIIERILESGKDREARWMWNFYNKRLLMDVAKKSKHLTLKSRNFWGLILKHYFYETKNNTNNKLENSERIFQ